jgi:hypothetical protein
MQLPTIGPWLLFSTMICVSPGRAIQAQGNGPTTPAGLAIKGDGVTDNAADLQKMVSSCSSDCTIALTDVVVASRITLPSNVSITFVGSGVLRCTSPNGCFYRHTTSGRVSSRITFSRMHFQSSSKDEAVVQDDLRLSSAGNIGMSFLGCSWQLSSGAIGWATSGAYFNIVAGNDFDSVDGTGVAIQPMASGVEIDPSEVSTVTGSTFRTLAALRPSVTNGAADA